MAQSGGDMEKHQSKKQTTRALQSEWIFDGEKEVIISHGDQQYRLQVTRAGKLILTK